MKYGKLINGTLQKTGKIIHENGRVYVNPTEEILIELGYKPVIETERPEEREGYYIVCKYEEKDDGIYIIWIYEEIPEEEEISEDVEETEVE